MPAPKDKITEAIRKMQEIQKRVQEEAKKVREGRVGGGESGGS